MVLFQLPLMVNGRYPHHQQAIRNFYYNPCFMAKAGISAGGGITPYGMIRTFTDQNLDLIYLLYGCRSVKDALFLPELRRRAELHTNKFELVLSEPDSGVRVAGSYRCQSY